MAGEGGAGEQGGAAGRRGEGEAGGGQSGGRGERGGRADPAGRKGPAGAFDGVDAAVGPVVERHPGLVEAEGRAGGEKGAVVGPVAAGRGTRQQVAGDGEEGGDAQQFGPGAPRRADGGGTGGNGSGDAD